MVGKNIVEAVNKRSITNIRSALKGCINQDVNFSKGIYQEAIEYVFKAGISKQQLYDVHDNENLLPQTEWNKEYLNQLMADLLFNFSEERIEMVKKVGKYIYPAKRPEINTSSKSINNTNDNRMREHNFPLIAGLVAIIIIVIILLLQITQK